MTVGRGGQRGDEEIQRKGEWGGMKKEKRKRGKWKREREEKNEAGKREKERKRWRAE